MLSVVVSCLTLIAMWLVSRKDWRGWAVGLVNQSLWLWLIIDTRSWGLLILSVALVVIYTRALIRWRAEQRAMIERALRAVRDVHEQQLRNIEQLRGEFGP